MPNIKNLVKITVNGKPWICFNNTTLNELINNLRLKHNLIAIEHNKKVIPPSLWTKAYLSHNDIVEIITIVGGG
nr:thiamine biosynthesis protein S [Cyanidiaceae sp.]